MGVWAGNRRHMAGDDVSSSVAVQLQTARAVEELEKAILQLKDRIEKLEVGMRNYKHFTKKKSKGFLEFGVTEVFKGNSFVNKLIGKDAKFVMVLLVMMVIVLVLMETVMDPVGFCW